MSGNKRYTYNPYELWIIDNKGDKEYYSIEEVAGLLNEKEERIIELEKEIVQIRNDFFEKQILEEHWRRYGRNSNGYTGETTDDIRFSTEEDKIFEERTRKALERVEKSDRKPLSPNVFLDELKNW